MTGKTTTDERAPANCCQPHSGRRDHPIVRPLTPSLGGRENPRPDYSTPFQKISAFFVDLIKDASTNSAWPSKKQMPHFSLCHAFAFDF